jgi:uncharacterized membrane protein
MPADFRYYSAGPLTIIALIVIIGLLLLLIPLLFLGLVGNAFTNLVGLSWLSATALVILILLCSLVNIPVWKIRRETIRMPHHAEGEYLDTFPGRDDRGLWETTIAINLGGAVIFAMACYLLYSASLNIGWETLFPRVLAATLIVAAIAYVTTRPLVGVGIRTPLFVPGLAALLCGILFTGSLGLSAGVIACVSATLGTLLGANLMYLPRVGDLEVSQVSIGGSGTFGTIFIACILSALIAV